jgi:hypothetical protein
MTITSTTSSLTWITSWFGAFALQNAYTSMATGTRHDLADQSAAENGVAI